MRNIINISLPKDLVREVEKEVKKGKFSTKSEYFRYLLRSKKIAEELDKRVRDIERGKGKLLKSLSDLD